MHILIVHTYVFLFTILYFLTNKNSHVNFRNNYSSMVIQLIFH